MKGVEYKMKLSFKHHYSKELFLCDSFLSVKIELTHHINESNIIVLSESW